MQNQMIDYETNSTVWQNKGNAITYFTGAKVN